MVNVAGKAVGKVQQRPAETSGLVGAVVILVAKAAGITDPDVLVAMAVVFGATPSVVTWLVNLVRRRNGSAPPEG